MRDSLTILAIALIVVLTAALVGPYLIDWSAERGLVQARLSEALGAPATIHGPIDLKLLPSPYFVVEDIEVGGGAGGKGPALSSKRLRLEIAPAALLRGEIDFVEARLEAPRLAIDLAPDGTLALAPPEAGVARRFRFEKITVANGVLNIFDAKNGRNLEIAGIDLEAEADSLSGPFKGRGAVGAGEARTQFRFATGAIDKSELNLKLAASASPSHPGADLDGTLSLRPGVQRFTGAAVFSSGAQSAWRASGQLAVDASSARFDQIELRAGEATRELSATGQAELDFSGAPKASVALASDDINLDVWRGGDADFGGALATLTAPALQLPLTLTYAAKNLTLGGAAFTDVSANLVLGDRPAQAAARDVAAPAAMDETSSVGRPAWLRFEARGPGKSHLFLDGQLRIGAQPDFDGRAQASAGDARWLVNWLTPLAPQWTAHALPFHAVDFSARTTVSPTLISLRDIAGEFDGDHVSGTFAYRPASGSEPARFDADLSTPTLDLSGTKYSDPGGAFARTFGASDGSLRLEAEALTLGRGDAVGALNVDVAKTGEKIELNQLTFEGQDSSVITASGLLARKNAHVDAKATGPHAHAFTALLAKFMPGAAAEFARQPAVAAAPIDLTFAADAAEKDSVFAITALAAQGSIGEAAIEASVKDDEKQPGVVVISAGARAKDGVPLLRLLGLAPASTTAHGAAAGAALVQLKAKGPRGQAAKTSIKASIGAASLTFEGDVVTDLAQPAAKGSVAFSTPDATPILRAIGLATPDFVATVPMTAAGDLNLTSAGYSVANLKADIAGISVTGALARAERHTTGSIAIGAMPAATLFALLLGPPEPVKTGALWPTLAFAPVGFELPEARVSLTVKDMALPAPLFQRGASAKDVRATLLTGPELLDLQELSLDVGGGKLAGEIKLRRTAADASIEGHLDFAGMTLDSRAVRGSLSGGLDIAGTGKSAGALAASLAGSGRAAVTDLVVPQADPGAVARVFAAFDRDGHKLGASDVAAALALELKRGDFKMKGGAFDIAIAAGMAHFAQPAAPEAASAKPDEEFSASFDIGRGVYAQRLSLPLEPPPKNFSGPPPQVSLLFQGPFMNLTARIDASALANTLASRSISRESARIESFEFDIHERAFFYHRLLSERRRDAERLKAESEAVQKPAVSAD